MGGENLAPTGIPSPDRAACGESLYRLSYPDPRALLYIEFEIMYGFPALLSGSGREMTSQRKTHRVHNVILRH